MDCDHYCIDRMDWLTIIITVYNVHDFVLGKTTDEELCQICRKGEDSYREANGRMR